MEQQPGNTVEEHELIELRSDEVQEIMGTPPRWIVRYGTMVVMAAILIMLFVSYVVKYPDVVSAQVVLTTAERPESINARMNGQLDKILVEDREIVEKGQLVAIMKSNADNEDVGYLQREVLTLLEMEENEILNYQPETSLILGEIQVDYSSFMADLSTYKYNIKNGFRDRTVREYENQIFSIRQNIKNEKEGKQSANERLKISIDQRNRIKEVYARGAASYKDLMEAIAKVATLKQEVETYDSRVEDLQVQIKRVQNNILDVRQNSQLQSTDQYVRLKDNVNRLKNAIERWKQNHLIESPSYGRVSLPEIGRKVRFVTQGEEIMAIVPVQADSIVGKVRLPIAGSGKVRPGQLVVIKFDSYPYQEYGVSYGRVINKSLLPKGSQYLVEVSLDTLQEGNIITSHSEPLIFDQEMSGLAEIITEDRRFIHRVFEKLFSMFENHSDTNI